MYQKRHARSLAKDPQAPGSRVASCFQGRNQPDLGRGAVPNRKQSRAGHSASLAVTFFSELSMRLGSRGSGGARRVVRYPCRGGFTGVRAPAALGPLAPWRPLLGSWNVSWCRRFLTACGRLWGKVGSGWSLPPERLAHFGAGARGILEQWLTLGRAV